MANVDFQKILEQLKEDVVALAKLTLKKYSREASKDATAFLTASKEKLKRWTDHLAEGKLTAEDFEFLVNSQKDLAQMQALKQAGLAKIRIDQFKDSVFNLVVDTILDMVT